MNMIQKIPTDEISDIAPAARGAWSRLSRWQRRSVIALPLVLLGGVAVRASGDTPSAAAPPVPTVTIASPLVSQVNEWDDYVGRFEASRTVEVRPRVSGAIVAVHFTDGAVVRPGQLLFTIDPRPFTAALAEARAAVQGARSDLALARADFGRALRLLDVEAVSRSDVDRLRARVQAGAASLAAAEARVRARALDVEFTQVRAPIGGRISDRRIDPGNLVSAGEGAAGTLLTTINALDPIYFSFDASEGLFLKARRARAAGVTSSPVEIRLQDETGYRWKGSLDFADNGLDPRSGTIRLRAVLRNPDQFLTPGMFGNMRLSSGGTEAALLIPDAAVQTDQARKIVLVVGRDGSVTPRPVILGPVIDGLRIVRSGLSRQDRVVISGTQMAMPGTKVKVRIGRVQRSNAAAFEPIAAPVNGEATFAGALSSAPPAPAA
jgi:RND family efflux transporter MFP subunit